MSGRSRLLTFALPILGCGALIAGTGLVIENRPITPEELPPRPPTTAPIELARATAARQAPSGTQVDAAQFIGAIGVSEPPGEAIAIAPEVSGVVTAVPVGLGQDVAAGAVLFEIDSRRAASDVALREAQVEVAAAEVLRQRGRIEPARADVASAAAAVNAAQASVVAAEAALADRANQLRVAEAVDDPRAIASEEVERRRFAVAQARANVDTAKATVIEAEAKLTRARADLELLVSADGGAGPDVRASEQRVVESRRALERTRVELELHAVRAPVDARVLQLNLRPGEFALAGVAANEGLVVLGRRGPVHLRVEIDEVDLQRFSTTAGAWASPRGAAQVRLPLEFAYAEPLVVPKQNLSGRTSERVDTRVLQVVYRLPDDRSAFGIGQQYDVYIEAVDSAAEAR